MSQNVESVENLIKKRKLDRKAQRKMQFFRILKALGVHLLIGLSMVLYIYKGGYIQDNLEIRGRVTLSQEEIESQLHLSPISFMNFGFMSTRALEEMPILKSINLVEIGVRKWVLNLEEYRIVAQNGESTASALIETGVWIKMPSSSVDVPILQGYESRDLKALSSVLASLNPSALAMISKIQRYPVSYDENYMKIWMQDGIQVFSGTLGLKTLNDYVQIISVLNPEHQCIAIDETTSVPYSFPCAQAAQ